MSLSKKRIVFLLAMLLAGSLFTVIYLAMTGNGTQEFTDVVIEYTAIFASNKSAERKLVFLLIFVGVPAYGIYFFCSSKKQDNESLAIAQEHTEPGKIWICVFGVMAGVSYFVSANINAVLMGSLIAVFAVLLIDRTLVLPGFVFYYTSIYAIYGLYRVYVFAGGEQSFASIEAALFVTALTLGIMLVSKNKHQTLLRGCLAGQILIPAVLLVCLTSKYKYQDEMIVISVPIQVKVLIFALLILFLAEDLWVLKKGWKSASDLQNVICFGTCVCIMSFNRFSGTGAVISSDMHHPFENIIGYSQIFELGQKPFSEYIPVSGMYSIVQGAVFRFFGNGQAGNYYISENVFYLFAVILVIALLGMQVSRSSVFLISLLFYMSDYNRNVFVLPVMLLLLLPQMIRQKNLWLKAWFLTSLFQGLYYPLFGAAVCVAFLPLGIWQIVTYAKAGQLKTDVKTVRFWIGWGICVILALACIPCLTGTYTHMKAMAGQTIYADGIARFGQFVPDWFFPYLKHMQGARIALYYSLSFMIPAGFVWVAFALMLEAAGIEILHKKWHLKNPQNAAVFVSLVIMPIICFSSTFVRLDMDSLYARSSGHLFAGAVLLVSIVERYLNQGKGKYLAVCTAVLIPAAINAVGFYMADTKLKAYEEVPENYSYIEKDEIERLGTGFLEQSVYDSVTSAYHEFAKQDRRLSYCGKQGNFGFFYLNNVKGDGTIEIAGTVKGYEAVQEAINIVRKNKTVIGTALDSFQNYYMYHWLMTSGEYVWSEEKGCFVPNNESAAPGQVREIHKRLSLCQEGLNVGKCAGALGLSRNSLMQIFTEKEIAFTVKKADKSVQAVFQNAIDGDEADYMYLEFADMDKDYQYTLYQLSGEQKQEEGVFAKHLMKKCYNPGKLVRISWMDDFGVEHSMYCEMNQGKLLVPLGAGAGWLLHKHTQLQIRVIQDGLETALPEITEIQFLKLREAG